MYDMLLVLPLQFRNATKCNTTTSYTHLFVEVFFHFQSTLCKTETFGEKNGVRSWYMGAMEAIFKDIMFPDAFSHNIFLSRISSREQYHFEK